MKIKTNSQWRHILYWYDLTDKERKDFDYLPEGEGSFFRYKGQVYDMGEFSRIIPPGATRRHPTECANPDLQDWDAYASDSFFSGIVVKIDRDGWERVKVGRYYS